MGGKNLGSLPTSSTTTQGSYHVLGTYFMLNYIPNLERFILLSSSSSYLQTNSKGLSCLPQNCAPVRIHLENMNPVAPGKE